MLFQQEQDVLLHLAGFPFLQRFEGFPEIPCFTLALLSKTTVERQILTGRLDLRIAGGWGCIQLQPPARPVPDLTAGLG